MATAASSVSSSAATTSAPDTSTPLAGAASTAVGNVLDYDLDIPQYVKDRVWIHAPNGETVGRFGKMGIDVHTTVKEQLAGAGQCRYCTHGHVTRADWERFRRLAWMLWGVYVPKDAVADLQFAD